MDEARVPSYPTRVFHNDPSCPVCRTSQGFVRLAASLPAPYPNPEYRHPTYRTPEGHREGGTHGFHWYHGTSFSPEDDEYDEQEGGTLHEPDTDTAEFGTRAGEHWNTDLGVHFSSLHHVAEDFADKFHSPDARIAHATLHMKHPAHFEDEDAMAHAAVSWARKVGYRHAPDTSKGRQAFLNGDYDEAENHDTKHRYFGYLDEHHSTHDLRAAAVDIDRHGSQDTSIEEKEHWLGKHPEREDVTSGWRQHLQNEGHDGITYGNSYEGPPGHKCAIAFPETPVNVHHWEWLHREKPPTPKSYYEHGEKEDPGQLHLFSRRTAAADPELSFEETHEETGGSKWPTKATLHALHPEHGDVGFLRYRIPRRKVDRLAVDRLEVPEEHRGNGYAGQLMDEMQRRYPGYPIDHGDRTDAGAQWWVGYSKGKPVRRGRTMASTKRAITDKWPPYLTERPDWNGDMVPVNTSRRNVRGPVGTEDEAKAAGWVGPYFHGTSRRRAHEIRRGGFRQPRMHNWEMEGAGDIEEVDAGHTHRTFFADNHHDALHFARSNHGENDADVVMAYLHPDHIETNPIGIMPSTQVRDAAHAMAIRPTSRRIATLRFEHHPIEGQSHRLFAGTEDEPRQHFLEYRLRPDRSVEFDGSLGGLDRLREKAGPEVADALRAEVLRRHDATEYDPASEPAPKPQRKVYYHGTTVPDVTHILPAERHGHGTVFPQETDRTYAYATPSLSNAWEYAHKARENTGIGRPRVYQVRPIGGHQHVEEDPHFTPGGLYNRGNNLDDVRSRKGFEVVREMAWPKRHPILLDHPEDYEDYEEDG